MPDVSMTTEEWNLVLAIIAKAPWETANPLLLKMGEQLRAQALAVGPQNRTTADEVREERRDEPEHRVPRPNREAH